MVNEWWSKTDAGREISKDEWQAILKAAFELKESGVMPEYIFLTPDCLIPGWQDMDRRQLRRSLRRLKRTLAS
jgi:predicted phosphohydrolase